MRGAARRVRDRGGRSGPGQAGRLLRVRDGAELGTPRPSPGVWALQNVFIALGQKKAKASGGACGGVQRGRRGRVSGLPAEVVRVLDEMLEADASIKPAVVLAKLKTQFPRLDPALHKNVKQRVSTKKTQLKKNIDSL